MRVSRILLYSSLLFPCFQIWCNEQGFGCYRLRSLVGICVIVQGFIYHPDLKSRYRTSSPAPSPWYCIPHWRCARIGAESPPPSYRTESYSADGWVLLFRIHSKLLLAYSLKYRVLSLLIPAAFFNALDHAATASAEIQVVSDATRHLILEMSRGIAVILLLMYVQSQNSRLLMINPAGSYIASRIFIHNPPGGGNAFMLNSNTPDEIHMEEDRLVHENPEVSSWFCILFLLATIAVMAVTAEMVCRDWVIRSLINGRLTYIHRYLSSYSLSRVSSSSASRAIYQKSGSVSSYFLSFLSPQTVLSRSCTSFAPHFRSSFSNLSLPQRSRRGVR